MTTNALSVKNFRLLPSDTEFLDRKIGSSGEIYYDRTDNTIRYFNGTAQGGYALAIDDLSNVTSAKFRAKTVNANVSTVIYTVTIQGPQGGDTGNKYVLNGVYRPTPNFVVGYTYVFNQDDPTNVYFPNANGTTPNRHPLNFSADNLSGILGGGTSYLNNVVYLLNGIEVTQAVYTSTAFITATSRQVRITITNATPATLYYWCYLHVAMGNSISVADPGTGSGSAGNLNSLTDVVITSAANGQVLKYNGTNWINDTDASGSGNAFTTIAISGQDSATGFISASDANDTLTFAAGTGITLTTDAGTDTITITNTGAGQNTFSTVAVAGQSSVVADIASDTLTLAAGTGITLTTNAGTDTITITGTASTGNITFVANTIDSTDSTAIIITPLVSFESDVVVGNEIVFADGSRQSTSAVGVPGPQGPQGPAGASGAGSGDVLSAGGGYVDNRIVRYDGTTGTIIQVSSASISDAGLLNATSFSGDGSAITALNATELASGTIPNARFPATLPAASGVNLTALNASNLGSGTVPDAQFPATLPAASGVNLTALNATQLTSGTVPDARFPATLPAASGVNLTALNASNLGSGTVPVLRLGASGTRDATTFLRGDNTWAGTGGSVNTFSIIEVSGQTPVEADTSNDTLTLVAGANVTITTSALSDTITIAAASGGVSTFSALTEAVSASLTIDKIYLPAITMLTVTNYGSFSYLFDQYGATENPTIYVVGGMTIAFNLNVPGHPFLIQSGPAALYNDGLVHVSTTGVVTTGSAAQGKVFGTLYWKVPASISGGYRYQCSEHLGMVGAITVKNIVSL